jgi:predicted transcriptional regulator YheO
LIGKAIQLVVSERKKMSENETIIKTLIQIADGIVNTFPRNFEVVVHDLSQPQKSIKHIAGDVTHRKPGGPVTDLVLKALHQEGADIRDRHNYKTTTKDGRTLKSTTVFIRNDAGEVVSALCINFDMTDYLNASRALDIFTATSKEFNGQEQPETFATNIQETLDALFEQAVSKIGRQPVSLSTDERVQFIGELEASGAFQFKGAVDQIAQMMGVSKYTIYNYLKKVHTERNINKF